MSFTDQIRAKVVSRDTRLLNILLNNKSSNGDPIITVEQDVSGFTAESDVYIYDLDLIGDDSGSIDQAISDLKTLPIDKPLILIGSRATVGAVAGNTFLKEKVARTMSKPLSYRQLMLAISSSTETPTNDISSKAIQPKQAKSPRLVVLSLSMAALLIAAVTFFQNEKAPLPNLSQEIVKPSPPSNLNDATEVSSYGLEIQRINELAQLAFNEGRLIFPENNNVLFHLKQIEEYDSYNAAAHQIRNKLIKDLKELYEHGQNGQDTTNRHRVLSKIVELQPYNQEYANLLVSVENNSSSRNQPQNQKKINVSAANTEELHQVELPTVKEHLQEQQAASAEEVEVASQPELANQERQLASIAANAIENSRQTLENQERTLENIESVEDVPLPNQENKELQINENSLASIEPLPDRIEPAKILKRVEPTYPRLAVDLSYEGWVELDFQVDEEGNAVNIETSQGERIKTFEQAAIKAIKKWQFEPSTNLNTGSTMLSEPMKTTFYFSLD